MGSAPTPRGAPQDEAAAGPTLHWWGTLFYIPILYGLGWLISRPFSVLFPAWRADQVDLLGVVIAFALLLFSLPRRLRHAWGCHTPWRRLGVCVPLWPAARALAGGVLSAALLLGGLSVILCLAGWARWQGSLEVGTWLNGLALLVGVGLAEELLFRGWLWGELEQQLSPQRALLLQAVIFALVHPWMALPAAQGLALLLGLILLALALALQRHSDGGALWGCVGLHGGLVGGWFCLQNGGLWIDPRTPAWLIGGVAPAINPIGGLAGWIGLLLLSGRLQRRWARIRPQRTAVARAARPSTGA